MASVVSAMQVVMNATRAAAVTNALSISSNTSKRAQKTGRVATIASAKDKLSMEKVIDNDVVEVETEEQVHWRNGLQLMKDALARKRNLKLKMTHKIGNEVITILFLFFENLSITTVEKHLTT